MQMNVKIERSWKALLKEEFNKEYFLELTDFIRQEYKKKPICPEPQNIFKAFDLCPVADVKVVILGQDPYHTKGVANGLAFSTNPELRVPPSLQNIYKEIYADIGTPISKNPDLSRWVKQGVLLLNATLSVQQGLAGSHQKKGWEDFTDEAIRQISLHKKNLVFLLWGAYAQQKLSLIDTSKHLVLASAHPSPFSAHKGFFGNKHFSKTNSYLVENGIEAINW